MASALLQVCGAPTALGVLTLSVLVPYLGGADVWLAPEQAVGDAGGMGWHSVHKPAPSGHKQESSALRFWAGHAHVPRCGAWRLQREDRLGSVGTRR